MYVGDMGLVQRRSIKANRSRGGEMSDAKRLRALENENGKLKELLAEQMLDNAILRDINQKNGNASWEAESRG